MDLPGEIGTYIKGVGEWTMDLGLTTAGGAIAAQGLGALLEIIAKKLDETDSMVYFEILAGRRPNSKHCS